MQNRFHFTTLLLLLLFHFTQIKSVYVARMMCTAAPPKIPMSLIQELRNRTGAGVTDCKKGNYLHI